ncbi:hypothetical protein K8I85_07875, partial [bacterium]|nr:hypothetical protein [bacterium]
RDARRRRGMSARAVHRVMRVARTIADLEGSAAVALTHLAEAARFRILSDGRADQAGGASGSGTPMSSATASR